MHKYYSDFIKDKLKLKFHQYKLFIEDLNLSPFHKFKGKYIIGDNLLKNFLRPKPPQFTQWNNFFRMPKKLVDENYICLIQGKERFKIVSPIYR